MALRNSENLYICKQCCGSMTFWCGSGSAEPCPKTCGSIGAGSGFGFGLTTLFVRNKNRKTINKKGGLLNWGGDTFIAFSHLPI